jgi:hypothetical protein|tara:strand:- start:6302 stop:6406 length:105 start_codon:yes stop_codon:yes gene_type:complete
MDKKKRKRRRKRKRMYAKVVSAKVANVVQNLCLV